VSEIYVIIENKKRKKKEGGFGEKEELKEE